VIVRRAARSLSRLTIVEPPHAAPNSRNLPVGTECLDETTRARRARPKGSASRVRDQLSLPRRDADPEEILLRLRQLQSGYEVSFSVGLTYTFGSIFNNIVNPRFGR